MTALALVASVLVAAPVSAADDPAPDFGATFDACADAPSSDFTDVSSSHANAGDIDCIAYYGVTKGTSATTYSPMMSVTREHMALFLIRLAGLVGIEVASDPADPGYSDIGDLSAGSQTAIAQLADLGITTGTSDTTYSPGDSVERGHMALFIARLMDLMDPMTDGVENFGSTPSDVEGDNVGSPFTDLGSATKSAYDAITALYELGVASGISDTAYGPSTLITRASMAGFMAAVLDHSNVRPAGLSIQASTTSGFGALEVTVLVSVRDDSFASVADQAVDVFNSESDALDDDGVCVAALDCVWNSNDEITDGSGNIFIEGDASEGATNVYYAWIGEEDGDAFDADDVDEVSVSIASTDAETGLKVTSNINSNAAGDDDTIGRTVDLDVTDSVTFTVQLMNGGADVARSGVEITVGVMRTGSETYNNTMQAVLKTDDDGQATYTVEGPTDTDDEDDSDDRTDTITFAGVGDDMVRKIVWDEDDPVLISGKGTVPPYAVISNGQVTIKATATLYDQYGNPIRVKKGQEVRIVIDSASSPATNDDRRVSSRGAASYTRTVSATAGAAVPVTYTLLDPDNDIPDVNIDNTPVTAVTKADDGSAASADVDALYADENKFRIDGVLYSYDSGDIFVSDGKSVDIDKFEELLGADLDDISQAAQVEPVSYDDNGDSIFKVGRPAS